MARHVWRGAHDLRRPNETVEPGEEFDPTDSEQRAYADLIEPVEEPEDDGSDETEYCTEFIESRGEECGRERPCQYHD